METSIIEVSVVVPVEDEEESVPSLAREIEAAMAGLAKTWECLWVDDGSTDRTLPVLQELCGQSDVHRCISLDGNFGQSAALAAGLARARGAVICTLDGDGQNDPADFPALLARLEQGDTDMVNGVRARRHDSWIRKISSRIANGFRNFVTREKVRDVGCSLRVFRRECSEDIPVFKGMHRFFPTLVRMRGFRITEMPVNHRPRVRGQTKYGISNRLWVGLGDTFAVRWMQSRLVWPRVRETDQEHPGSHEK